jgi:hypothetical protein
LKTPHTKRAGGVAQGEGLEFNPHLPKKVSKLYLRALEFIPPVSLKF